MSSALAVARRPEVPEPGQVVEVRGSTWAVIQRPVPGTPSQLGGRAVARPLACGRLAVT